LILLLPALTWAASPTVVDSWADLNDIRTALDGNYILDSNLDSNSAGYVHDSRVGGKRQSGLAANRYNRLAVHRRIDGNGHTITGLTIYRPTTDYQGLFGRLDTSAVIQDVGVVDCNIKGKNYVGALVGYLLDGSVSGCYATGKIHGTDRVGGLIGQNSETSSAAELLLQMRC